MNTTRLTSCFFANITHDTHLIQDFRFGLPASGSIHPSASFGAVESKFSSHLEFHYV